MRRRIRTVSTAAVLALTFVATGCTKYFEIRHPGTDEVYYSKGDSIKQRGGSLEFKDEASGSIINLSNAQRRPITREEFRANTGTD